MPFNKLQRIGFLSLLRFEMRRILRIWRETLLPPLINSSLYLVLGSFLQGKVGSMEQLDYLAFIIPGLVLMTVINASFANACFSLFSAKFQRSLEELIVSPLASEYIVLAYILGGIARATMSSLLVLTLSSPLWPQALFSPALVLITMLSTATLFSLAGYINGMLARRFDDLSVIPNFILTPLTFLGGVFFSVTKLGSSSAWLLQWNPIAWLVSLLRYGFWGGSHSSPVILLGGIWLLIVLLAWVCLTLTTRGYGLLNRG